MKRFEELTYYDILEIPPGASDFEIRQAYKDVLSIYEEDSPVTYSLFTDDERGKILKKVEDAFFTLIDKKKRSDYDRMLVRAGKVDAVIFSKKEQTKPIPIFHTSMSKNKKALRRRISSKIKEKDIKERSKKILSKELLSGRDLKNIRESIGIELEEVFDVTRINPSILKSIEEDLFERLPPKIYLENFLGSYAEILELDSERVVDGYTNNMTHIQEMT